MRKVRSLPLAQWPAADLLEWECACAPGLRLKRGGRASHLKPVTRDDLTRGYGYFLTISTVPALSTVPLPRQAKSRPRR